MINLFHAFFYNSIRIYLYAKLAANQSEITYLDSANNDSGQI